MTARRIAQTNVAIKATHVIIGGSVFPWAAKAPYVAAGKSTLGALEYNDEHDVVKCHVCGDWLALIGTHLSSDGITAAQYKRDYGLRMTTSLCAPSVSAKLSRAVRVRLRSPVTRMRAVSATKGRGRPKGHETGVAEDRNLKNLCQAQLRHRVLELAVSLGGTPTGDDLRAAGIASNCLRRTFGVTAQAFMASLGLTPNRQGGGDRRNRKHTLRQPLPPQDQMLRVAEAGLFSPA
jgi:hypothetical protein